MSSGIVESQGSSSSQEKEQSQQAQRSRLVSRLLAASPDLPGFLNDLITTQAVVVAGTEAAAFIIRRGEQSGFMLEASAHVRPDGADDDVRQQALEAFKELVKPCVTQNRDGAIELSAAEENDEGQYCLVTLLRNETALVAVSAVITRCRDVARAQERLVGMQLVAGYFDLYSLKRKTEQALQLAGSHQDVLQYATAVGTAENFANSAANLCNVIATRTGAVRVCIGWVKGNNIKVKALSHTENFDKRQELITDLQRVMEEAADQDEPVYYNPNPEIGEPSSQNVTREASAFSRKQGGNSVLAVPLRKGGEIMGVVTLEWAAKVVMPTSAVQSMTVACDVLAPQLEDRYQNDRWIITKAGLSARDFGEKVIGPKHMLAKLVCTLILVVVVVLFAYHPMYRVAADFQFATIEKRVIPAPFDGYLASISKYNDKPIKAGMQVPAGTSLAQIETTELEVQRVKALREANAYEINARQYTKDGKMSQAAEASKRAEAAQSSADLYDIQIKRANLVAPIEGHILRSEVDDRVGGQVKAGEPLFEVAEINQLKVELTVKENDIQLLQVGQKGELATKSEPGKGYFFTVDRIVPQGQPKEGNNVFTVYGTLDKPIEGGWRPGIQGVAKVDIGKKPLYYHWTHRFVDWVQLQAWKYGL